MKNNIFFKNLVGIVKKSYDGNDKPVHDWQTSIDMYSAETKFTDALPLEDLIKQRSEFLQWVANKVFDKDGNLLYGDGNTSDEG